MTKVWLRWLRLGVFFSSCWEDCVGGMQGTVGLLLVELEFIPDCLYPLGRQIG